jgi:hypothetical protein
MELIDVSGVRDSGMQALVLLARSLDWNVMQKVNNPVVITSRSGVQRRIPTNTSIRMSVFQTHLSAIMLHSTLEGTVELMDQIIKATKPNREQANRLRLAVGQSVQEHRRQTEDAAIPPAVDQQGPLTQNIEIQWEEPPMTETVKTIEERKPTVLGQIVHGAPVGVAADGKDHGRLKSKKPFLATINKTGKGGFVYESKSSFERIWDDGYYDYECMVCGVGYPTPKGVGSHRQTHVKFDGAIGLDQKDTIALTKRRPTAAEAQWILDRDHGGVEPTPKKKAPKTEPVSDSITPPKKEKVPAPPVPDVIAQEAEKRKAAPIVPDPMLSSASIDDSAKLEAVMAILVPDAIEQIESLLSDNDRLTNELRGMRIERDKLRSDLATLKELVGGLG